MPNNNFSLGKIDTSIVNGFWNRSAAKILTNGIADRAEVGTRMNRTLLKEREWFDFPLLGLPKLHGFVRRAGNEDFPGRVESDTAYGVGVRLEGGVFLPGGGFPDTSDVVITTADQLFSIGAEGDREDDARVSLKSGDLFCLGGVVDLGDRVVAGHGDALAIGGKLDVMDR